MHLNGKEDIHWCHTHYQWFKQIRGHFVFKEKSSCNRNSTSLREVRKRVVTNLDRVQTNRVN